MIALFSPLASLGDELPALRRALLPLQHRGVLQFVPGASADLPRLLRDRPTICLLSPAYLQGPLPDWLPELPAWAETRLLLAGDVDGSAAAVRAFAAAVDGVIVFDGVLDPRPDGVPVATIDTFADLGGERLLAECQTRAPGSPQLRVLSQCDLPTEFGEFRVSAYAVDGEESALLVAMGDLVAAAPLLVRVHSECFTGEVLASLKCDCDAQLRGALRAIASRGRGALIYLRQEGRGIGLANKIAAYAEQQRGADTVEANHRLGFPTDLRDFSAAALILRQAGVRQVELLTHNPSKVRALRQHGVRVAKVSAMVVAPNAHNLRYLQVKHDSLGHVGLRQILPRLHAQADQPPVVIYAPPPANPYTGGYLFNARVAELASGVRGQFAEVAQLRAELQATAPGARIFALDSLYLAALSPRDWEGHTVVQIVHSLPPRGVATAQVAAALQQASGCITTSKFMAGEVAARAGQARVQVCRPGVVAQPQRREASDGLPVVVTVANGERRKGHLALLAALGAVRDLPWRWQVIGDFAVDPAYASEFVRALADSGLLPRVQLLGVQTPEQVRAAMAQASVFALLSDNEPYGMVYAESLAAGTPVLAWRQAGVLETVQHDVTGRLVRPGDSAQAADELRALLGSPELRDRLRAGCVAAARELPDWPSCAQQFAALCRAFAEVRT